MESGHLYPPWAAPGSWIRSTPRQHSGGVSRMGGGGHASGVAQTGIVWTSSVCTVVPWCQLETGGWEGRPGLSRVQLIVRGFGYSCVTDRSRQGVAAKT